jgi:hypothetical protein
MENVVGALTGVLVLTLPLAVLITKGVDLIRNLVDSSGKLPKFTWNIAAFVLGLIIALGWQINFAAALADVIPSLQNTTSLDGVAGQILTGLAAGAMASFWHEKLDQWSAGGTVPGQQ